MYTFVPSYPDAATGYDRSYAHTQVLKLRSEILCARAAFPNNLTQFMDCPLVLVSASCQGNGSPCYGRHQRPPARPYIPVCSVVYPSYPKLTTSRPGTAPLPEPVQPSTPVVPSEGERSWPPTPGAPLLSHREPAPRVEPVPSTSTQATGSTEDMARMLVEWAQSGGLGSVGSEGMPQS